MTPDPSRGPEVRGFYDPDTGTVSYLVKDPASSACAIVDSVLDLDWAAGRIAHRSADALIAAVRERGLRLEWQIETHAHADHLSAAPYIKAALGGRVGIGAGITAVQEVFGALFDEGPEFRRDGSQFDHLFRDGETYRVGGLTGRALATPGHTPACMTHVIGDAAFVGDTLFMPDAARRGPTSRAATRRRSIGRSAACSTCRRKRGSSSATTTGRPAARRAGRPRWPSSGRRTSTCATASTRRPSSPCAGRATGRSTCRASSSPLSR